jgi:hypothetical protein
MGEVLISSVRTDRRLPSASNAVLAAAVLFGLACRDRGNAASGDGPSPSMDAHEWPAASCERVWTRLHNAGGDDHGVAIAADADGNLLVAGDISPRRSAAERDIWVRKYDPSAREIWTSTYDSGGVDEVRAVTTDSSGQIVVAGHANGRAWVRKYGSSGAELWTRLSGPAGADDVAIGTEGDVVVATGDLGVIKYDASGTELWRREENRRTFSLPSVATDDGGSVVVAGTVNTADGGTVGGENTPEDIWLSKYDAAGTEVWTRSYDGGASDRATDVALDPSGNVYVMGVSFGRLNRPGLASHGWRRWLRKVSADGLSLWTLLEDGPAGRLRVEAEGGVLVVGWFELRRYDAEGRPLWTRTCSIDTNADVRNVSVGGAALDLGGHLLLIGTVLEPQDPNLTASSSDIWIGKFVAP